MSTSLLTACFYSLLSKGGAKETSRSYQATPEFKYTPKHSKRILFLVEVELATERVELVYSVNTVIGRHSAVLVEMCGLHLMRKLGLMADKIESIKVYGEVD